MEEIRYFYHPESDCLWTETNIDSIHDILQDMCVMELSESEYIEIKRRLDKIQ